MSTDQQQPTTSGWVVPGARVSLRTAIGGSGTTRTTTIERVTKTLVVLTNGVRLPLSAYNSLRDAIVVVKGDSSTTLTPTKED